VHGGQLGSGTGFDPGATTLDQKAKPEKQQKNLEKAITKLLKNYPPPPPKK